MTSQLSPKRRVLILGATGMLGHTLMSQLTRDASLDVHGSARSAGALAETFGPDLLSRVTSGMDATDPALIDRLLDRVHPDVVVNCIGVIKQDSSAGDTGRMMALNAELPHLLADACEERRARLIHISTDCVFSGRRGRYVESDEPDPIDTYGRSKLLGEVHRSSAVTLRTSFIGHEIGSQRSLVDWFLSQVGTVNGFTKAIYSGLTAVELAHLLASAVFPREDLTGLYHVASTPISKYELLSMIALEYGWKGQLVPSSELERDRSLVADSFRAATGYRAPEWPVMINEMYGAKRSSLTMASGGRGSP